jgi:NADH dehydrogenase
MALFLPGATGFIGRRLLPALDAERVGPVHCLVRGPVKLAAGAHLVTGDLLDPSSYAAALAECDTVVHLAALTGKASFKEHRRVNVKGTAALLEACREVGVKRFIHVSTIAVTYPDQDVYAYAQTKTEAEELVRVSRLDFAIVRPTIVLGPGSPLGDKFRGLSTAPAMIVFGHGRTRINPVHVGDVVACLEWLAESETLGGRTFGLGGRDVLTIGEFQRRIRWALCGKDGPVVRVPLRPIVAVIAQLQKFMLSVLPVTAGQFYAFLHDSVPELAEGIVPAPPDRRGVDDIIADQWGGPAASRREPDDEPSLAEEADTLCRHLTGQAPSEYVRRKYVEAHVVGVGPDRGPSFDDTLVAFARRGPNRARLADAYAAVFSRGGTLRRKLVLLLAILESTGETSKIVDAPDEGSASRFILEAVVRCISFPAIVLLATLWLGPRHLRARFGGGGDGAEAS